ncbi:MAG: hypothetical protein LBK71_05450 [Verrucomicrobiales bacterium]|jgi:hypothetical protein|nr:hypothetical protein [Verrucomicrobiales bacterium]
MIRAIAIGITIAWTWQSGSHAIFGQEREDDAAVAKDGAALPGQAPNNSEPEITADDSPREAGTAADQRELLQLTADLKLLQAEVQQGEYKNLSGLAERIGEFKNNLYYPYLLAGLQVIIRPAKKNIPPDLLILSKQDSLKLLELSNKFLKVQARIAEIKSQGLIGLDLYVPVLGEVNAIAKGWPELEGLREFAEQDVGMVLDNLWLAALQWDKPDSALTAIISQLELLAGSGALSAGRGQELKTEVAAALDFKRNLQQWQAAQKYREIAELPLPPRVAGFAPAQQLFATMTQELTTLLADADRELAASRAAYAAQQWSAAEESMLKAFKLWPQNPQRPVYYEQLSADFTGALANGKKGKTQAEHILRLLNAGWPEVEQTQQLEQDLHYTKSFMRFFDDFSVVLIGSIALGVVLVFLTLKYLGRLFSA